MAEDPARNRLGRGLATLISELGAESANVDRSRPQRRLPIEFLRANPSNPRRSFDSADLDDLTNSVREKGVVQPILVRPVPGAAESFEIIAGERRWRAAQKAGLHDVPVVVREASDKEALELAIIENVQRSDLNALEEAEGYQQLIDEHDYEAAALANVIGKSRSHVANTLSLLKLPPAVQAYLREGKLTAGHARALVNSDDPEANAKRIVESGMNVREAETLRRTQGGKGKTGSPKSHKDADTIAMEKTLSDLLGLTVSIDDRANGGKIHIAYKTLEQLDAICRRLQGG
jgi:ParB family transcriptional regulator, chromosome partitioning protein